MSHSFTLDGQETAFVPGQKKKRFSSKAEGGAKEAAVRAPGEDPPFGPIYADEVSPDPPRSDAHDGALTPASCLADP